MSSQAEYRALGRIRRRCGWCDVLDRLGPHLVAIDEEHRAIREDGRQLREAPVAFRGSRMRGNGASGERLETQEQPRRIVLDLDDERAIRRE
jgi:hypothetical protein